MIVNKLLPKNYDLAILCVAHNDLNSKKKLKYLEKSLNKNSYVHNINNQFQYFQ